MRKKLIIKLLPALLLCSIATSAHAINALQLGESLTGTWNYDTTTETWVTTSSVFSVIATANATKAEGGNGKYAWEQAGATTQTAYIVFSAMPIGTLTDGFNITPTDDDTTLSFLYSDYGNPPIEDSNSLAPHGIYPTYFEIYQFNFNDSVVDISDTQPGQTGIGKGFIEEINVTINSLDPNITGIHIDLFTVKGDGILVQGSSTDVLKSAPFSHDAEYDPGAPIPEPTTMLLFGTGLVGLAGVLRKKRK